MNISRQSLPSVPSSRCDLVHIAAQDRRQIGVDHGGVAAADQLHQGRDLVADGDLRKADLARDLAGAALVRGVAVAVHEHDGDGANAGIEGCLQCCSCACLVERRFHGAVGQHAFIHFDDLFIQQFRLDDLAGQRYPAAPDSRFPARRETRAWSTAVCDRPCAPAGHWWQPWCPS